MADIVLKDVNGDRKVYTGIDKVSLKDTSGEQIVFAEEHTGEFRCLAVDYDGTILKEQWLNVGETFTPPAIPTHERLTFQEWSSSIEPQTDGSYLITNNDLMIGPVYVTKSTKHEFDIVISKATGLTITFNGEGEIDWGDGATETITGTTSHTYPAYGEYTLISDFANNYAFGQSQSNPFLGLKNLRIGTNRLSEMGSGLFCEDCSTLKTITIPKEWKRTDYTIIPSFRYSCDALKAIIIPIGCTLGTDFMLAEGQPTTYIVIPYTLTEFPTGNTPTLRRTTITIPNGLTSYGSADFDCENLLHCPLDIMPIGTPFMYSKIKSFELSASTTTLPYNAFSYNNVIEKFVAKGNISQMNVPFRSCSSLKIVDLTHCTAVPVMQNTVGFSNGSSVYLKIFVPDELYDAWIVASNWIVFAKYIYKASEMEV